MYCYQKQFLKTVGILCIYFDLLRLYIQAACPIDSVRFGNYPSCYWFSTTQNTWDDARQICQGRGGDLLVVNNDVELRNFKVTISGEYWIGLTDKAKEADWIWIETSNVDFRKWWQPGQPDNIFVSENCAEYFIDSNAINDQSCGHQIHSVCKKVLSNAFLPCPNAWFKVPFTLNCYLMDLKTSPNTFDGARKDCEKKGGFGADLAVPKDSNELAWIRDRLMKIEPHYSVWLGLKINDEKKRTWAWLDGTQHDESMLPWNPGEPNGDPQDEDCAIYEAGPKLKDQPCFYAYKFICETPSQELRLCEWPPPTDVSTVTATCEHPTKGFLPCANYVETHVMAILECPLPCVPSTGIPIAMSLCEEDGNWSRLDGYKCNCDKVKKQHSEL